MGAGNVEFHGIGLAKLRWRELNRRRKPVQPIRVNGTHCRVDWQNEPATWKQLRYLRQHGHKPDRHLTKTAAAELIQSIGGPVVSEPPPPEVVLQQLPRQDAYLLRQEVEQAGRTVSEARADRIHGAQQGLAIAISKRQMFWIDTCRDPTRMQAACGQVLDFYRKYGCQFEAPSNKQVQEVLSALDSAVPFWDRDHPALFYQTLELNFQHLSKRR
jgi:hypothetical protein